MAEVEQAGVFVRSDKDIGLKAADLDKACDIALQNQYPNPRPLERVAIRQLFQDAFEGARPRG